MITTVKTSNPIVARHIAAVSIKKNSSFVGIAKSLLIEEAKRQMREGTCRSFRWANIIDILS